MLNDVIAITNRKLCQRDFLEQIKRVCEAEPKAIILREKDLNEKEYTKLAEQVYNITNIYNVRLIIHTYINVAEELGLDTVHMSLQYFRKYKEYTDGIADANNTSVTPDKSTDASTSSTPARIDCSIYPADEPEAVSHIVLHKKIGCSIHSVEEAVEAQKLGASYITAGHIYATDCKKGLAPRGLEFLKEVCESVTIPVYAIGGIDVEGTRRDEVKMCGAAGSCIMSGMMRL